MSAHERLGESAEFHVEEISELASSTVIAGFSEFGLAGLTAVDYLVDHLDLEEVGHVVAEELPSITPFEEGRPRHHTRLLSRSDLDVTVLVGELFVPPAAAKPFADAVLDWVGTAEVDELAVLSGVPVAHGPDAHRTFHVATDDYRRRRLEDAEVAPMGEGFLDGVNSALVQRGMSSDLAVGVFVTPAHAQAPDAQAALRLLETVTDLYDLDVDVAALEEFAGEVHRYYEELSQRVESARNRDAPEDRMFN